MANKNMTRAIALTIAIADAKTAYGEDAEVVAVLTKIYEQVTKPRTKSNTPSKSKARMSNETLAKKLYEMCGNEPFNCTFVQEHLNGVMTPQKAVAVMNVGIDLGLFAEGKEGKKRIYTAVR